MVVVYPEKLIEIQFSHLQFVVGFYYLSKMPAKRQLAAIMFTDIVGYTRLMGENEEQALALLRLNRTLHQSIIKKHHGKWLKEMGDGTLASFKTISDAVYCTGKLQEAAKSNNIQLRIGMHLGEITEENRDIFGDGVNVASRIEPLAEPGQILVSDPVYQNIKNKPGITSTFLKEVTLKNIDEPVKIYSLSVDSSSPNEEEQSWTNPRRKKVAFVILGLALILLIGYSLVDYLQLMLPASASDREKSIAVLPFRNDSPNEENLYFCNGIMEGILDNLAKIPELTVVSRTSGEQYRENPPSIPKIAEELNVNYILEGSVLRIGDRVRISAQLLYAPEDKHIWSQQFDKNIENAETIFEVLAEVTRNISEALKTKITPELQERIASVPTTDLRAYDYFLQGKEHFFNWFRTHDKNNLKNANRLFDLAIKHDPSFGLAYAGKAAVYGQSRNVENYLDSVLIYTDKAILLDPNAAFAYVIRGGSYYMEGVNDMKKAGEDLNRAFELNPNDDFIVRDLAIYYAKNQEYIKALRFFKKAEKVGRDPLGLAATYYHLGYDLYLPIGDMETALYYINKSSDLNPLWTGNNRRFYMATGKFQDAVQISKKLNWNPGYTYAFMRGKMDSAVFYLDQREAEKKLKRGDSYNAKAANYMYAMALINVGSTKEGMTIIDYNLQKIEQQINDGKTNSTALYDYAAMNSFLGKTDLAIEYIKRLDENYNWQDLVYWMQFDLSFDNLRENEEFQEIINKQLLKNRKIREEIARLEAAGEL